jgi:hypothetical protein
MSVEVKFGTIAPGDTLLSVLLSWSYDVSVKRFLEVVAARVLLSICSIDINEYSFFSILQATSPVQLQMLRLKASHDVGKRDHGILLPPI